MATRETRDVNGMNNEKFDSLIASNKYPYYTFSTVFNSGGKFVDGIGYVLPYGFKMVDGKLEESGEAGVTPRVYVRVVEKTNNKEKKSVGVRAVSSVKTGATKRGSSGSIPSIGDSKGEYQILTADGITPEALTQTIKGALDIIKKRNPGKWNFIEKKGVEEEMAEENEVVEELRGVQGNNGGAATESATEVKREIIVDGKNLADLSVEELEALSEEYAKYRDEADVQMELGVVNAELEALDKKISNAESEIAKFEEAIAKYPPKMQEAARILAVKKAKKFLKAKETQDNLEGCAHNMAELEDLNREKSALIENQDAAKKLKEDLEATTAVKALSTKQRVIKNVTKLKKKEADRDAFSGVIEHPTSEEEKKKAVASKKKLDKEISDLEEEIQYDMNLIDRVEKGDPLNEKQRKRMEAETIDDGAGTPKGEKGKGKGFLKKICACLITIGVVATAVGVLALAVGDGCNNNVEDPTPSAQVDGDSTDNDGNTDDNQGGSTGGDVSGDNTDPSVDPTTDPSEDDNTVISGYSIATLTAQGDTVYAISDDIAFVYDGVSGASEMSEDELLSAIADESFDDTLVSGTYLMEQGYFNADTYQEILSQVDGATSVYGTVNGINKDQVVTATYFDDDYAIVDEVESNVSVKGTYSSNKEEAVVCGLLGRDTSRYSYNGPVEEYAFETTDENGEAVSYKLTSTKSKPKTL